MTITWYQATAVLSSSQISQLHRWVPGGDAGAKALQCTKGEAVPGKADLNIFGRWGRTGRKMIRLYPI